MTSDLILNLILSVFGKLSDDESIFVVVDHQQINSCHHRTDIKLDHGPVKIVDDALLPGFSIHVNYFNICISVYEFRERNVYGKLAARANRIRKKIHIHSRTNTAAPV